MLPCVCGSTGRLIPRRAGCFDERKSAVFFLSPCGRMCGDRYPSYILLCDPAFFAAGKRGADVSYGAELHAVGRACLRHGDGGTAAES